MAAQFTSEGATLSGVDLELVGSGYRMSLIKRRFATGMCPPRRRGPLDPGPHPLLLPGGGGRGGAFGLLGKVGGVGPSRPLMVGPSGEG